MQRRRFVLAALAVTLASSPFTGASAQSWPAQTVKLVVPFPAGSATDNIARVLAKELQDDLGQAFIVDNRPGAQGMTGSDVVARSAADGYTLLVAAVSFAATPAMFRKPAFDPVADFVPVSRIATTPLALMVKSDFPARTATEFIEQVRAQPGRLAGGFGSSSAQVCLAQLAALARLDVLKVPYKGIPLAVNDVLGGTLQFTFVDLGNAIAQAKGGRLRPIGVSSEKRNPLVPDWPALAETLPGFDVDAWIATLGPKGLPEPVARRLHEATVRAMAKPDVQSRLAAQGFAPAVMGPADVGPFVKAEVAKWARLTKQAGIEPE